MMSGFSSEFVSPTDIGMFQNWPGERGGKGGGKGRGRGERERILCHMVVCVCVCVCVCVLSVCRKGVTN